MADFTTNMSDTVALGDSIVQEYLTQFIVSHGQNNVMDQFVEMNEDIGAKSITLTKYDRLTVQTAALTEKEDPAGEAMVDTAVVLTPAEYGNVVTKTKLAELQTGGKASLGAVSLAAINMAESENKLATLALEATTNIRLADAAASEGAITASNIMDTAELDYIYNKMSRANVPVHPVTGAYVAFMHDDVIHDLRTGSAAGSWMDVNKYALPGEALKNEVGMFKGFHIVRNNHALLNADGGSTTVDTYHSSFMGFNGLGKAVSENPALVMTGPFDKLARFVNIGWYGVFQYKIIDTDAVWKVVSASSIGANT